MSERAKKIFLAVCIVVPFLLYCFFYYSQMFKNAPFRFTDFESIVLKYGEGDELINQFDSATGVYKYLNTRDSLVTDTIRLRRDDLQYLHGKAAQLGFWNLPDDMTSGDTTAGNDVPRFYLQYNYKEKSKEVTLDVDFNGNEKMRDVAKTMVDEVMRVINDARDRQ
ncbi:hypothetical protein [Parapedobacter indicus]|uniref:Uncharacterized protein n=1 Tax=Parapedobacter indicus TaxID=1477437 RepID=A0A1I3QL95_9SPHI|nr:hypothetical protein [Parapedobacter indicus]PPL00134.1 hypothetical protein CLV26_10911 [Parapedobacter indicus]SFJ33966.1 hypothetical protein SAMN05444682_10911 [Parapedobacter indicus]